MKTIDWFRTQYTLRQHTKLFDTNQIEVLYKSKQFLILNKPHDIIVYNYKKDTTSMPSFFGLVRDKFPFYYDTRLVGGFHVCHRLDSVTSGCICVPLNYHSQRMAVDAFVSGNVEKYYLALVYGRVNADLHKETKKTMEHEFIIDVPIGEDLRKIKHSRCTTVDKESNKIEYCFKPQSATTKVKILEYGTYNGKECTKLLIKPITGKRHQIRVHLHYIGHPIVGDMIYGVGDYDSYRTMLHSYKLTLKLANKKKIEGKAPDPFLTSIDPNWKCDSVIQKLNI
jgi:23S rRNA-/tRNA-specific pseudouridylate synthase